MNSQSLFRAIDKNKNGYANQKEFVNFFTVENSIY